MKESDVTIKQNERPVHLAALDLLVVIKASIALFFDSEMRYAVDFTIESLRVLRLIR